MSRFSKWFKPIVVSSLAILLINNELTKTEYDMLRVFKSSNYIEDAPWIFMPTSDISNNYYKVSDKDILFLGKYDSYEDGQLKLVTHLGNKVNIEYEDTQSTNIQTGNAIVINFKLDENGSIASKSIVDLGAEQDLKQHLKVISVVFKIPKSNIPLINYDIGGSTHEY